MTTSITALLIPSMPSPTRPLTATGADQHATAGGPGFTTLTLPIHGDEQSGWLGEQVGGHCDTGRYRHGAVLHLHGNGRAARLDPNPVAWTLACAWYGQQLPTPFYGPAVLTGDENDLGVAFLPLTPALAAEAAKVIATVTPWWVEHAYQLLPVWAHCTNTPTYAEPVALAREALHHHTH